VKITTHFPLEQKLKVTGSLLDFMACTGKVLLYRHDNIKLDVTEIVCEDSV
jgi:hypothetical protein